MEESFSIPPEECGDSELDPRIQLELEKLNTATAEINKLELELDESNTTFRMLLNEATRRLKGLAARLGSSVDRARPYHEAASVAASARVACQRAAVSYQRASEIHAAAKETVALAEQRFKSKQHEWQFDNAWQEMLNHATIKVMDAENQKAESGREHQKRAQLFNVAETKLQHLEEQLRKHIAKSRPYFEEKQLCQEQLATQKSRIEQLQRDVAQAKGRYARSLRALEAISEEIHRKRRDLYGDTEECPVGPREPGVGAEKENCTDYSLELERHGLNTDLDTRRSECGTPEEECVGLEELRRRVRRLAARPLETGGSHGDSSWEDELNSTVQRLDQMLLAREQQVTDRERRMLTVSQSAHSSRDKLSDPFYLPAVLRSHSSHDNPLQLIHGHSDVALTQNNFANKSVQQPITTAHIPYVQNSELFYSEPDISAPHAVFAKMTNVSSNHPNICSSHSSYDNSLEFCENLNPAPTNLPPCTQKDLLNSKESQIPSLKDDNALMKDNFNKQLCLSVSALEELLPAGSKEQPQNFVTYETNIKDDTKYIPFTYNVTFDSNEPLNTNILHKEQNIEAEKSCEKAHDEFQHASDVSKESNNENSALQVNIPQQLTDDIIVITSVSSMENASGVTTSFAEAKELDENMIIK